MMTTILLIAGIAFFAGWIARVCYGPYRPEDHDSDDDYPAGIGGY